MIGRDAGAFLAHLLRLDAAAVVRLRPADGAVGMWARLPFGVLVTRAVRAEVGRDVTVRAKDLFEVLRGNGDRLPTAVDAQWRWPLPPGPGTLVEELPAADVRRVADAAAQVVRDAIADGVGGRAVGTRRIRDAMLDHVPFVVEHGTERFDVPQRQVQGLVRMGFLGTDPVAVRRAARWTGLAATHGSCWYLPIGETLSLQVAPYQPNG
jgi:hypothetical protein